MTRVIAACAATALTFIGPAATAQQVYNDTGVTTETQDRSARGDDDGFPWDLLGLLGLAGLLGLRRRDDHVVTDDARR
ncbi:WGxxGxxG family protein [uncultured Sphingomonas sp.]|uniref:WGxxGxxG family protein n=1 Tax=uncultured Sphingomonas sp. TaxID=158754 RepID=UPI0035CAF213